ncbi:MAG: endo-1,4-beta-xylanase [Defluviitaleaceae bacterium]|nr:endo-1,4-beta-xylanase [Defluviitaleaceae bacterium]
MHEKFSHRRATKKIALEGAAGKEVKVRQLRHKFLFGCSEFTTLPYAAGEMSAEDSAAAEKRYGHVSELFNSVTLPFYWGRFEPEQGKPDTARMHAAAKFLRGKGMTLKGHPLCWHTVCADWLLAMDNDKIFETQISRIRRDIEEFAGVIDMWDVINEAVIMPLFNKYDNAMTRLCKEHGRIKLIRELFREARSAGPKATLLINDFETGEAYDILVEGLLEAGVPIDVIGIQSHMHQGWWGEAKASEILERFSRFNLPLHFTEVSLVSGDIMPAHIVDLNDHRVNEWPSTPEGLARQAAEAVEFYELLFAHHLTESVTWWSFRDGGWLKAPSGLLDINDDPKPAYTALHKKIKGEWWTGEQTLTADASGEITITGVKGDYVAAYDGREVEFTL